ncbi:hypothetical protein T4B_6718 [Trichinella pseudospiralis]|uniref:Uncharacterized protein n=1 Tax=Trichinella pseudospiralis TaxID=6337 RepID=A0A0V1H1T4_TRIPS|nr:hypothetical protein T4B_6718 [Trichinella pseudospiralis]
MNELFNILCGSMHLPITPLTHFYPPQSPAAVLHQQLDRRFRRCAAALPGKLRIIFVRLMVRKTSYVFLPYSQQRLYIYLSDLLQCSFRNCGYGLSGQMHLFSMSNAHVLLFIKKNNAVVTSFPLCPRICYPPKHLRYCRPALCSVLFCQNISRFFTITVQDVRASGAVLSEKLCIVRDQRSALHYPTSTTMPVLFFLGMCRNLQIMCILHSHKEAGYSKYNLLPIYQAWFGILPTISPSSI